VLEVLGGPAFYVSAIGSHCNTENRRQQLMEYFDATEDSLARLRAPAGI
jgi:xanthine dehydrogenase accessory factor